jgi:hypothetical protein
MGYCKAGDRYDVSASTKCVVHLTTPDVVVRRKPSSRNSYTAPSRRLGNRTGLRSS